MKIFYNIFLFGLSFLLLASNSFADDFTFRKTSWGMSLAEVKSSEPLEIAEEQNNMLLFKTNVLGKDVGLVYFFIENVLVRSRYYLVQPHSNKNDYISDYNDFKNILIKKYGSPKQDEILWKNNSYKDDPSRWGMAISIGELVYTSSWETEKTEIHNLLVGENYEVSCLVEYVSKDHKEIVNKANEKKALEQF